MSLVSGTATALKATALTVPDIGVVFDYDPFPTSEWNKYVANFTTEIGGEQVVRAWTIKNVHRDTVPLSIAPNQEVQRVQLRWVIRGFLGVRNDGATDVTFRDLLELLTETLNANRSLSGAPSILDHDPADYDLPNNGALLSLGDTICHYGEVTFTTHHEIVVTIT